MASFDATPSMRKRDIGGVYPDIYARVRYRQLGLNHSHLRRVEHRIVVLINVSEHRQLEFRRSPTESEDRRVRACSLDLTSERAHLHAKPHGSHLTLLSAAVSGRFSGLIWCVLVSFDVVLRRPE